MKNLLLSFVLLGSICSWVCAVDLVCCGADEVYVIDPAHPAVKKWSWKASASPSVPTSFHPKFRSTDECKPYADGTLLITSSSGGVALVARETKACRFLAESRNAHSACLLPGGQLVVAASYGGDQLQFFDRGDARKPAVVVQAIPLKGAHGVVWDEKRGCLWALGGDELLRIGRGDETWGVGKRYPLPSAGGHDLSVATEAQLFVTTNSQVLRFHRDSAMFEACTDFGNGLKVKSVDRHVKSGRIVYHQATKEHWWSDTIRFVDGEPLTLTGERLYKLRWDQAAPVPE